MLQPQRSWTEIVIIQSGHVLNADFQTNLHSFKMKTLGFHSQVYNHVSVVVSQPILLSA